MLGAGVSSHRLRVLEETVLRVVGSIFSTWFCRIGIINKDIGKLCKSRSMRDGATVDVFVQASAYP